MKVILTTQLESDLAKQFPILEHVANAIKSTLNISIDDIRSADKHSIFSRARCIFTSLCFNNVTPRYMIGAYINRSHSNVNYYIKLHEDAIIYDKIYADMFNKVKVELDKLNN